MYSDVYVLKCTLESIPVVPSYPHVTELPPADPPIPKLLDLSKAWILDTFSPTTCATVGSIAQKPVYIASATTTNGYGKIGWCMRCRSLGPELKNFMHFNQLSDRT